MTHNLQLKEIVTDKTLRELTQRGTLFFPIEMYCNDISLFVTRNVPWHWHEECELVFVKKGEILLISNGKKTPMQEGAGAFINSNQLHSMQPVKNKKSETINIVFNKEVIAGAPQSIFDTKYVMPLTANSNISTVDFAPHIPWQNSVLKGIKRAFSVYEKSSFGYEMHIRSYLSEIWLNIWENSEGVNFSTPNPEIKKLLTYIQTNYMHNISLGDIAKSTGICQRTCCRWFNTTLRMTPFQYLTEYRVKMAATMLTTTTNTITDICFAVGFNDTSYFTKVFSKITGQTPKNFRKTKSMDKD